MKKPTPFGKYLLLERISVGGMAEVFRARPADAGADPLRHSGDGVIAIKKILPSMAEDADFITMFTDEARIAGQLDHRHIARIFELGRVDDTHFIAMEYVWGKDLLQIQNRFRKLKQKMSCPMAAFVASKMCAALDYAHKKSDEEGKPLAIIHRDVSPQNILVSYEGDVKVIDFGIAKAASRSTRTQAGVLKGKFGYMSPEQVSGLPLDHRSDVFAIGTILYELISADRAFLGESDFATLERVRNVEVAKPSEIVPSCPPELERIILKALARETSERYQWAAEMERDLDAHLASLSPAFARADLSSWMKDQFAEEMNREARAFDEQLAAATTMTTRSEPVLSVAEAASSTGEAEETEHAEATVISPVFEALAGEATVVTARPPVEEGASATDAVMDDPPPDTLSGVAAPAPIAKATAPGPATQADPMGATLALEAPANLAAEIAAAASRLAAPPVVVPVAAPDSAAQEMPSQTTAILESHSITRAATARAPGQIAANPTTSPATALPFAAESTRSTLTTDVIIGVGVAAAIVIGVLFWRGDLRIGSSPAGTPTSMDQPVVVEAPSRTAPLARTPAPSPPAPPSSPDAPHAAPIALAAKPAMAPTPQEAPPPKLPAPPPPAPQEPAPPVDKPVPADTPTSDGLGHLSVTSDPPGCDVNVDGKPSGQTPAEIGGIARQKTIRVTVRKSGYVGVARYLYFEKQLRQTLEVTLSPDGKAHAATPHSEPKTATSGSAGAAMGKATPSGKAAESSAVAAAKAEKSSAARIEKAAAPTAATAGAGKTSDASAGVGYLIANTTPWARIFVDDKDTGVSTPIAPRSRLSIKEGKHVVSFQVGGRKYKVDVEIKVGETARISKVLEEE